MIKNLPTNARDTETRFPCLGQKDLLEKEVAAHSSILAWKMLWTRSLVGYTVHGSQRAGHN